MKHLLFLIIPLFLLITNSGEDSNLKDMPKGKMGVTVLYDNYVCTEGTESDWGFSCLIETDGQNILFDTGTQPDILYKNIGITGVDLQKVDQIVISHNHHDHIGGLEKILGEKTNIPVHIPYFADKELSNWVAEKGAEPKSSMMPYKLSDNIWASGTMGEQIPEHCVIVDHEKGLIVVVGCSHPGISEMLEQIKKEFGKEIFAVMGGFHLRSHSENQVEEIIKEFRELGVKKCGCTHCTGEKQIQQFREAYGEDFIEMGTGRELEF